MRYITDLSRIYAYYPNLSSAGPSDEQLRLVVEDAEDIVDADLEQLGFKTPITAASALPQVRRLVVFRVLADLLSQPLPGMARATSPTHGSFYEQKYRDELAAISRNPARMGDAERTGRPEVFRTTRSRLPGSASRPSLVSRVRRWMSAG